MRFVVVIARVLLGLMFVMAGANILLSLVGKGFMPEPKPEEMKPAMLAFMSTMGELRYFMPLLGLTQLVSGLLIATGFMVPLGLTLLAPVLVNIVLVHQFVEPNGLGMAYVLLALEVFLAYAYWPAFRGVLDRCAKSRWSP